jgi:peptide/nickel transport system permease protein
VIGLTGWTDVARFTRGEYFKAREMEYVLSAKALGLNHARIIFRHILPNAMAPILVILTFDIAGAILLESGLSFLGFGVSPPTPTWGSCLNEASSNFASWWQILFPGLAIFLTVTAFNLVGEGLRDAVDPKLHT